MTSSSGTTSRAEPHPGPDHPFQGRESWTRLSRFTIPDGSLVADPRSELVLIEQRRTNTDHMGGGMFFHPRDGFLYLGVGDGGTHYVEQDGTFALESADDPQRIDRELLSGVLRIDVDRRADLGHPIRRQPRQGRTAHYFVPDDNPWVDGSGSVLEEFFAIGLRNPHRMAHDPVSDQILVGDVGARVDEINHVVAGGNYGWSYREGPRQRKRPPVRIWGTEQDPIFAERGSASPALIGGHVYRGRIHDEVVGKYVFGENGSGQIWALDPAAPDDRVELMRLPGEMRAYGGLSSFALDADGELYVCILGDNDRATGSLQKLVPAAQSPPPPPRLSETRLFGSTRTLEPAPGLFAYDINVPFWSDHADKRRWLALPRGSRIGFPAQGHWTFPIGTVAVKHFDLAVDERDPGRRIRLETRVLALEEGAGAVGRTYRWRDDGLDADLVEAPRHEHLTAISAVPFSRSSDRSPIRLAPGAGRAAFTWVIEAGDFDLAGRWDELGTEATGLMIQRDGSPESRSGGDVLEEGLLVVAG